MLCCVFFLFVCSLFLCCCCCFWFCFCFLFLFFVFVFVLFFFPVRLVIKGINADATLSACSRNSFYGNDLDILLNYLVLILNDDTIYNGH